MQIDMHLVQLRVCQVCDFPIAAEATGRQTEYGHPAVLQPRHYQRRIGLDRLSELRPQGLVAGERPIAHPNERAVHI